MHRTFRYYYLKLVRQEGTPEKISAGMSLGVFIGLITPPGPQMVIAGIIATIIHVNRITAVMGVWITNPLTFPFIYPAQIYLGSLILDLDIGISEPHDIFEFWNLLLDFESNMNMLISLLVGAFLSSVLLAVLSYYVTWALVIYYRKRKLQRRLRLARQKTP